MKTLLIRLTTVDAAMLEEIKRKSHEFRNIDQYLSQEIQKEYKRQKGLN
jgi:hypothetical protein